MSRYTLKPLKREHQGCEIVVGWDSTLGNFFGEVRQPRVNDFDLGGEVVVSIAKVRAAEPLGPEFKAVINAISDYAIIDAELRDRLWADSEKESAKFRS